MFPLAADPIAEARQQVETVRARFRQRLGASYELDVDLDELLGILDRIQTRQSHGKDDQDRLYERAEGDRRQLLGICRQALDRLEAALTTAKYEGESTDLTLAADLITPVVEILKGCPD